MVSILREKRTVLQDPLQYVCSVHVERLRERMRLWESDLGGS